MKDDGSFVLVGVGDYQDTSWPRLSHVPASVERLYRLFRSLGYEHELPDLAAGGDFATITQRLRAWHGGGSRLVMYWTGHGCADSGEHFLITADSPGTRLDELSAITGKALARFLAHREFHEVLILLDCCAGGVAASRVAAEICQVLDHTSAAGPERRFAVIASTRGYDSAEDGLFAETLEHVVLHGPEDRRWTEHDETIRSDELADAITRVVSNRDAATAFRAQGAPVPALRNPLHPSANVPDEDVETKRLRRLRSADVDQHLVLSARGIEVGETGWYFCGRERLLRRTIDWLERAERGLFAVTGSPGTGKSALLGRIATLSVPALRSVAEGEGALNGTPNSLLPPLGSIDLALSCRNKTLDDCLRAIADALDLPRRGNGWLPAAQVVRQVSELGRRVTVVLDGLDEAKAAEAVPIAADLLRPLADLPGVRVLVGTRPHRAGGTTVTTSTGPLLQTLAPDETAVLDDEPETRADLIAYAQRRLLGAEYSPLRGQEALAQGWALRIANASGGIFLYARVATRAVLGALARSGGAGDRPDLDRLVAGNLTAVLDEEFGRSPDPERLRDLLRPLAWAEGAGLPRRDLWPALAEALSRRGACYGDKDIAWVLEHAGFHVVESGESGQTVYRLYHQALIDHFRNTSPWDSHTRITRALLATLPGRGPAAWQSAHPYLRRHLPAHALVAGLLPEVMRDVGFLVCADPTRTAAAVRSLAERFTLPVARLYLRAAHRLPSLSPQARLRTLLMTAMFEEPALIGWFRGHATVQATLEASSTPPDDFSVVLHGHSGPVLALQTLDGGDGRDVVASASGDGTVRLWEPDTGETQMVLTGPQTTVTALTRLTDAEGRRLLVAAAGRDLHVWDLDNGEGVAVLRGHSDTVLCLTAFDGGDNPLLVSAGEDRSIRLWRTDDWSATVLTGHVGRVTAVVPAPLPEGRRFLLSTGADCAVRRWDVDGPEAAGVLRGHTGTVYALASLGASDEGTFAVSGGDDGTLRVWDVERLVLQRVVPGRVREVRALSPFTGRDGRTLLAVAGRGSRITVVDPYTGSLRRVLTNRMTALPEEFGSRAATGTQVVPVDWEGLSPRQQGQYQGHYMVSGGSYALAPLRTGRGKDLFASAGWDGAIRLWASDSGGSSEQPNYDNRRAHRVAAFPHPLDGLPWGLAVAGAGGGAWLTDARGRERTRLWPAHRLIDHVTPLVLPDGRPVVVLVEHEGHRLHLVDVETREEITAGETVAGLHQLKGPVASLRTAEAPGWMTALVVNYDDAPPQALLWLPGDRTQVLDGLKKGPVMMAVPCVRSGTKAFLAAVTNGGVILLHGTSALWAEGVGETTCPPVPGLSPVAARTPSGHWQLAVPVQGPDGFRAALELWDLHSSDGKDPDRQLRHDGAPFTHLARLVRSDQDLIVAACSDHTLRVWNPTHPHREPLTIPLPGPVGDLTTSTPDRVYVLIDEHWFALRLTGLGAVLSG
ncbi:WD40 repeat domain-containing protein [Streptomyces sp. S465]|uniref:WD40 repeat domain-containing protein n=1 Tax=Streptomyces sp. S465 TaxID=2979468 RepID=UPI0022A8338E|nr:WD40 repeat domain-containing protein [Streptomyces sp. S465]WAP60724.1 WD40 repeat domain-containing protein [Streptomyces sp. S465]